MSDAADLLARLELAVRQAVAAGEIGAAKSIRLHVGAPATGDDPIDALLALGDAIFGCGRSRVERLERADTHAVLCEWEQGQVGTITSAFSDPPLIVLTVLGQDGALHFRHGGT